VWCVCVCVWFVVCKETSEQLSIQHMQATT
jgi:hypothetical protein